MNVEVVVTFAVMVTAGAGGGSGIEGKRCSYFQKWARGCSMRPTTRTSRAAAVYGEERKVCRHQGGWRRRKVGHGRGLPIFFISQKS